MKPVVTAAQIAELDKKCIDEIGIPGVVLMENAGRGIFQVALSMLQDSTGKKVTIFCGPGNNGGDGFVLARFLLNAGAVVTTIILAPREKIKGDALINLKVLEKMACRPVFVNTIQDIPSIKADLIVDALLGTGVKGAVSGIFAEAVEIINTCCCPVLAVDIPTGVQADTGAVCVPAIKADKTVTMALKKRGLLLPPGRHLCGEITVIDIGTPELLLKTAPLHIFEIEAGDIRRILPNRPPDAHKNRCGAVAVIAGSRGYTGAAALAAKAVLRIGAGLGYLFIPDSLNDILESRLTEVITRPQDDAGAGYLHSGCYDELTQNVAKMDVIAMGPGLGQHHETAVLVHKLLKTLNKPVVLDADALNVSRGHTDLFNNFQNQLILTPHPGELSRLTDLTTVEIMADRIAIAQKFSRIWNVTLILKGSPTLIALPDGRIFINSTGNSGMATAGSGDVLTGTIAGLLAQGLDAEQAAIAGVYVHGLAGDLARIEKGEMGMIAGDILNYLPQAIKVITNV
ncbi:NAD(P)H-hydrate dehydratase [candidate division KSB1 bacterium]|nr:NAD(P)H-hydrate dehydratase [candidate division KSB1 bacterium]